MERSNKKIEAKTLKNIFSPDFTNYLKLFRSAKEQERC